MLSHPPPSQGSSQNRPLPSGTPLWIMLEWEAEMPIDARILSSTVFLGFSTAFGLALSD